MNISFHVMFLLGNNKKRLFGEKTRSGKKKKRRISIKWRRERDKREEFVVSLCNYSPEVANCFTFQFV